MSTRARTCLFLIAIVATTPAGSAGAAGWSNPSPIAGSVGLYPELAMLGGGGAASLFLGGPIALVPTTRPQVPVTLSSRPAGGTFGAAIPLPPGYGQPITTSPGGMFIAVGGPHAPDDYFGGRGGPIARLRVAIGRIGGPLHRVNTRGAAGTRTLGAAVNNRGDAAVVYERCRTRTCESTSIWAIFRRHGGVFSRPVALAGRNVTAAASVVINRKGDTLVAWEHSNRGRGARKSELEARVRRASGHFTRVRRVGSTAALPTIALTLTAHRAGTIAWFSEAVRTGSVGGPAIVLAARLLPSGHVRPRIVLDRFSPPAGLGAGSAVGGARLRSILDRDGRTTLAWTGHDNRYLVRAVRFPGPGEPQTLSAGGENADLVDLAGDGDGDALAVWIGGAQQAALTGTPSPGVDIALRRGLSAPFGFPELALVNSSTRSYRSAAAAIDGPGPRVLVAGGGEFVVNVANSQPVVTTERMG